MHTLLRVLLMENQLLRNWSNVWTQAVWFYHYASILHFFQSSGTSLLIVFKCVIQPFKLTINELYYSNWVNPLYTTF